MSSDTPLLGQDASGPHYEDEDEHQTFVESWKSGYHRVQTATSRFTNSRTKHWILLVLIILDVAGILSDIFIALITCEIGVENDEWVAPTRNALTTFSLVMSCIFLAELALSVFADGWGYFRSWFHRFDAFVVVAGFAVDMIENNTAEEIASLIVILRLWRFVKIVDEFSVEASEEMEEMRKRCEDLESRNAALEAQIAQR
ncbi:uncharacterized protein GGS22DRAFT_132905 [Annulohypoxylon maeteangense]|uniref:uncharacterized protein n=1 Tax=Annulohypoxylon maeteangense TaxID=1927788 RepID=UPI002008B608|nr:uncharacterized protein GGS22DRAFT_132905 [Annulohypoxylon maeteangense]KAI0885707.1 hypothetical protein GGS22DRAFT_132905 [Annulohypoxylon maeteangense]